MKTNYSPQLTDTKTNKLLCLLLMHHSEYVPPRTDWKWGLWYFGLLINKNGKNLLLTKHKPVKSHWAHSIELVWQFEHAVVSNLLHVWKNEHCVLSGINVPKLHPWWDRHFFQQSKESMACSFVKYILSTHSPGALQISLETEKIKVENKMTWAVFIFMKMFQRVNIDKCWIKYTCVYCLHR